LYKLYYTNCDQQFVKDAQDTCSKQKYYYRIQEKESQQSN